MGTAMGTKNAPVYVTLTLGFLELKLYDEVKNRYPENVFHQFKSLYFLFLDDVCLIYDKAQINIDDITNLLNNLNVNLTFKLESHGTIVNFLDICIYIENNLVKANVYYKPTDTKQYLDFHSNHPGHTKRALPYNLARRICVLVSDEERRFGRLYEMSQYLAKCSYLSKLTLDGIKRALSYNRVDLIGRYGTRESSVDSSNNQCNHISFVSTYNPNYETGLSTIQETFNNLKTHSTTEHIFETKVY